VLLDLLAHLEVQVLQVQLVILDQQVRQVQLELQEEVVQLDPVGCQAQSEQLGQLVSLDPLVLKVSLVAPGQRVELVESGRRELQVPVDLTVVQVIPELLVHLDLRETRAQQD